jgi:phage tail sheath protein FI
MIGYIMPQQQSIQPVETDVAAFVGRAASGPVNQPVSIASFSDYQRIFGELSNDSAMSFAVRDFYQNGGQKAIVLRLQAVPKGSFLCRWLQPNRDSSLHASDYLAAGPAGLNALTSAPNFGLLCLPEEIPGGMLPEVVAAAAQICEKRRAFLLLDPPATWTTAEAAAAGVKQIGTGSPNAAVFFPRLRQPNPLKGGAVEDYGPGGAVAGIITRLDQARGVWKAPAGVEAAFAGTPDLSLALTTQEMELLNPNGINALRALPDGSRVIWGSRTLASSDSDQEWKYISTRRTALFIEESIIQGIQWAASEPNSEALWIQLRKVTEDFLFDLFRKGALHGAKPEHAFYVRCDRTTMSQNDIELGKLNLLIGVALLKPAEFIILRIQQMAKASE